MWCIGVFVNRFGMESLVTIISIVQKIFYILFHSINGNMLTGNILKIVIEK